MSGPGIPNYLDCKWRRRGLDHDRFAHRNLPQAKPVAWPGKARVALWVAVHVGHFPMDMSRTPFVAPGGVDRPYPSYWDYPQRDYSNRVGIYRLMRALDARGVRATALLNSAFATLYGEAARTGSGRILTLTITPWLMGQPHRIRALGSLLDRILDHAGVWPATGAEIVDAWRADDD